MRRTTISLLLSAALTASFIVTPVGPVSSATCSNSFRVTDDGGRRGGFRGVAATSASDAWAVGTVFTPNGLERERISHWDGSTWTASAPPQVAGQVELRAVDATSTTDAWAVGSLHPFMSSESFAAFHWNGATWVSVATTNLPRRIFDVEAITPNDVWAVGFSYRSDGYYPRTMHWDGNTWTTIPNPLRNQRWTALYGVGGSTTDDIWAVGQGDAGPVAIRWDGTRWHETTIPGSFTASTGLFGVEATPDGDAWAVGYVDGGAEVLLLHWDGSAWTRAKPAVLPSPATPYGVSAASATDVWVAVSVEAQDVLLHWNGGSWTSQPAPIGAAGPTRVRAIASLPGGQTFAAGHTDAKRTYAIDRCVAL